MKRNIALQLTILLCSIVPFVVFGQQRGIKFQDSLTWAQVQAKAKAEHKFIFMDCYATWCGPCKWMDKTVYPNDTLGRYMNNKFLSVKVQMNKTAADDTYTRSWYTDANEIGNRYRIYVYPTFLFFTSDGKILDKEVGGRNVNDFIKMTDSLERNNEYYNTLVNAYEQGTRDASAMRFLITQSKNMGRFGLADSVSKEYITTLIIGFRKNPGAYPALATLAETARSLGQVHAADSLASIYYSEYLEKLPEEDLWTKQNIYFINDNLRPILPNSLLFRRIYKDSSKINSVMAEGSNRKMFSTRLIIYVIFNKEVKTNFVDARAGHTDPDWNALITKLSGEYDSHTAKTVVFYGETDFYYDNKNWAAYATARIKEEEEDRNKNALSLNNSAYDIFNYSDDKEQLLLALNWSKQAVLLSQKSKSLSDDLDTEANLLYKLGKKTTAIQMEEQAANLAPDDKEIQVTLQKMKIGKPTWISPI